MKPELKQLLLIIDFGSQFTKLIARRIRELNVYCAIHPYHTIDVSFIIKLNPRAIILSGGPATVLNEHSPKIPKEIYDLSIPILGICYGQQLMAYQLGGEVSKGTGNGEFGRSSVTSTAQNSDLVKGWFLEGGEQVWMSHGDTISRLPNNFQIVGISKKAPFAIIANEKKKLYGVQFHPEVNQTHRGTLLLRNFIQISSFARDWNMSSYKDYLIKEINEKVGTEEVICAISGGVDSSVVGVLLNKAIGDRLTCIFVDHGLLREGETNEVLKMFRDNYNIKILYAEEKELFLKALSGITDPEQKRKKIGNLFIKVFEKYAKSIGTVKFLAQGTLYPDVIESASAAGAPSATIKSHHNVGGLPKRMKMSLIEPLRELFKDEVRALGTELGIPRQFIDRHPFPGPGLAIRCPGEVTEEKLKILRKADSIFIDQIRKHGLYDQIWQAFVVLLPVRTVGVMGDDRTYDYSCVLRAVTSKDGMTADFFNFNNNFLGETATRIINEVLGINRVTYDITSKPPGTIEWE
ncbi:MAG: glutamine-hydrolyzing GMP synthase [Pseudomonadota bacterium]|nr:glutamine-hydrolyzing GMP synthase [Pseudomonadota bacterium]